MMDTYLRTPKQTASTPQGGDLRRCTIEHAESWFEVGTSWKPDKPFETHHVTVPKRGVVRSLLHKNLRSVSVVSLGGGKKFFHGGIGTANFGIRHVIFVM